MHPNRMAAKNAIIFQLIYQLGCQIQMHVGNMSIHTEFEIHTDLK